MLMHPNLLLPSPDRTVHLIKDVRFVYAVSGRRARRLVYAVTPSPWISPAILADAGVSLFLAS